MLGFVLRRVPVSALWRQLFPWIAFGAVIITISGSLLWSGVGIMGRGIGFY